MGTGVSPKTGPEGPASGLPADPQRQYSGRGRGFQHHGYTLQAQTESAAAGQQLLLSRRDVLGLAYPLLELGFQPHALAIVEAEQGYLVGRRALKGRTFLREAHGAAQVQLGVSLAIVDLHEQPQLVRPARQLRRQGGGKPLVAVPLERRRADRAQVAAGPLEEEPGLGRLPREDLTPAPGESVKAAVAETGGKLGTRQGHRTAHLGEQHVADPGTLSGDRASRGSRARPPAAGRPRRSGCVGRFGIRRRNAGEHLQGLAGVLVPPPAGPAELARPGQAPAAQDSGLELQDSAGVACVQQHAQRQRPAGGAEHLPGSRRRNAALGRRVLQGQAVDGLAGQRPGDHGMAAGKGVDQTGDGPVGSPGETCL